MLLPKNFRWLQMRFLATKHRHTKNTFYYQVLGVPHSASQTQIKQAYLEQSKKHHPDVSNSEDSKLQFQQIADAYTILGNVHSRRMYDRGLINRANQYGAAAAEEEVHDPFKIPKKPLQSELDKAMVTRYQKIVEKAQQRYKIREEAKDAIEETLLKSYNVYAAQKREADIDHYIRGFGTVIGSVLLAVLLRVF